MTRAASTPRQPKARTKPTPDRVKTDANWKDAIKAALEKKRPPSGWPKPPDTKHR